VQPLHGEGNVTDHVAIRIYANYIVYYWWNGLEFRSATVDMETGKMEIREVK